MKRNKFFLAFLSFSAAPFAAMSQLSDKLTRKGKAIKILASEGRLHGHLKLKGVNANIIDVKISGEDTDGDLAIFHQTSMSQGRGTPLHVHHSQDEIFYIVEGSYKFKVGEELFDLTTGDNIFLPRKVPHAWTQVSAKGQMNVILQPAGKLENFFVSMAGLDHEPSQQEISKLFSDNEMEIVGPPLKVD